MENNKLIEHKKIIAEYMGAAQDHYQEGIPNSADLCGNWRDNIEKFNYDQDWAWLMPVVDKIGAKYDVRITYSPTAMDVTYIERPDTIDDEISSMGGYSAITNTFLAVVKFIEWHNKSRKTTKHGK